MFFSKKKILATLGSILVFSTVMTAPTKAAVTDVGPEIVGISASDNFTCMNARTGEVYCWGQSTNSNLGTGMETDNAVPHLVYGIKDSVKVATGDEFACSLGKSGFVSCWGKNDIGQVGDGIVDSSDRIFPSVVAVVRNAVDISAGSRHACALTVEGKVYCWGDNKFGQLGDFTQPTSNMIQHKTYSLLPVLIEISPKVSSITSGSNHSCALTTLGIVYCWGSNLTGQLGLGLGNISISKPEVVPSLLNVQYIKSNYDSTCAKTNASGLYCWGKGTNGELGETESVNRYLPRLMSGTYSVTNSSTNVATAYTYATSLSNFTFGTNGGCGIDGRSGYGYLVCWGKNTGYETANVQALDVALGKNHGCLITITFTVACWGSNLYGQTGSNVKSATWQTYSVLKGIPEWKNYITTWGISYTNNVGTITWTGAAESKFYLTVEPFGFTCEVVSVFNCQVGPLTSNTEYRVLLLARGSTLGNSRSASFTFRTGTLVSTLDEAQATANAAAKADAEAASKAAAAAAAEARQQLLTEIEEGRTALSTEICSTRKSEIKTHFLDLFNSAIEQYEDNYSSLNTATVRIHEALSSKSLKYISGYKVDLKAIIVDMYEFQSAITTYNCIGDLEVDTSKLDMISTDLASNYRNSINSLAAIVTKWKKIILLIK